MVAKHLALSETQARDIHAEEVVAALRLLREGMSAIEAKRRHRIDGGEDPAEVDRDAAQLALNGVVTFLL